MEFVKLQIQRVQEQLSGLSASQKMLSGALLVIMLMTLYWWTLFAGKAEMAPVLDQGLSANDIAGITVRLRGLGIQYEVNGDRILIPIDRRDEVLADLAYAQALPRDTDSAFNQQLAKSNPFQTSVITNVMINEAKQMTLSSILRRFPRVADARVVIDAKRERGPNGVEPSAMVFISMRPSEVADGRLVNAVADLVSGAVANLKRSKVNVIIDGSSHPVRDRDSQAIGGDDYLAYRQSAEKYFTDRVADMLRFIDGAMISVSVLPITESKESIERKVDPKNVVQAIQSEETQTDETQSAQSSGGESGVISNGAISLNDGSAPEVNKSNSETAKTTFKTDSGYEDIKRVDRGGSLVVTACSVLIPRSHFVKVYKRNTNTMDSEPDAAALEPFIAAEVQRLKPGVMRCLGLEAETAVHVDVYTDLAPVAAAVAPMAAGAAGALSLGGHVKEIILGALALVSLLMVAGMVKKGTPAPAVAVAQAALSRQTVQLAGGEEVIGEAADGLPTLDAMEVDEDSMKAGQMVTQVAQLVGENPDAAANLVKRWLVRS